MPERPDWPIHALDEVGSTMDAARELADDGAPHGTTVTARVQTGGRGRAGRHWISPAGNLYATVVLRPEMPTQRAPELGFVVAVALAEAVDIVAGPGTRLKWPNDVLRDGAKLAGILLERMEDGVVLAGFGVNVAQQPADMPYPVTSLHALGCTATPDALLDSMLLRLAAGWTAWRRDGFAATLALWRQRGPEIGAALQVRLPTGLVVGTFAGLGRDGALLLDTPQGKRALVAGDVVL